MKNIYFIGNTMGTGKTTASQILKKKSAEAFPLMVIGARILILLVVIEKRVIRNMCYLLNGFI